MKAPDIVESWKWWHGELIGDRLRAESERKHGKLVAANDERPCKRDRYYTQARRIRIREAMKR
jgi:hypothetical protein